MSDFRKENAIKLKNALGINTCGKCIFAFKMSKGCRSRLPLWMEMYRNYDKVKCEQKGKTYTYTIQTPYGEVSVSENDYVVLNSLGDYYVCEERLFEALYNPVDIYDEYKAACHGINMTVNTFSLDFINENYRENTFVKHRLLDEYPFPYSELHETKQYIIEENLAKDRKWFEENMVKNNNNDNDDDDDDDDE